MKTGGAHNTDASQLERSANRTSVEGPVDPDVQYVIVDATFTSGDTVMAFIDHVISNGGTVSAVTTLADSRNQNYLKPRPQDTEKLLARFGTTRQSLENEIGFSLGQFTGAELFRIANTDPSVKAAKSVRDLAVLLRVLAGAEDGGAGSEGSGRDSRRTSGGQELSTASVRGAQSGR